MRTKLSGWSLLSCLAVVALVAAGCAPAAGTATSAPQATAVPQATEVPQPTAMVAAGTATISFVQEPDSLNPWYTTMFFSQILTQFYLKSLWSFDAKNQPVPEIATEIPSPENGGVSADGKTITVKLRSDVSWSDGEPVTADDFVFTYEMVVSDKNVVQTR